MRKGIVCGKNDIALAAANGFSYAELPAVSLRGMTDSELSELRRNAGDLGIALETFCVFFGSGPDLYAGDPECREILEYAEENFRIARSLGGSLMVIGSGRARSVPEGMERVRAEELLTHVLTKLSLRAEDHGLTLALEPLRFEETNMVNTVTEAATFVRAVGRPNFGCLVDFYHLYCAGESIDDLSLLRPGELIHAHLARPNPDRLPPKEEDAGTLKIWADKLREIGYNGRLTLECRWDPDIRSLIGGTAAALEVFD